LLWIQCSNLHKEITLSGFHLSSLCKKRICALTFSGYHSNIAQVSSPLGCHVVSMGRQSPTLQMIVLSPSSMSSSQSITKILFGLPDPEAEDNYYPSNTASHLRRTELSEFVSTYSPTLWLYHEDHVYPFIPPCFTFFCLRAIKSFSLLVFKSFAFIHKQKTQ
jgi:hypothetical protein